MTLWEITLTVLSPLLFVAFCVAPFRTVFGLIWLAVVWSVIEVLAQ